MRLDETLDEYPAVPPARRKLAQDAHEQGLRGQRAARYWARVELHASAFMAAMLGDSGRDGAFADYARDALEAARALIAEIDSQRAEEEGT